MTRNGLWQCAVCGYVYDPAEGDPEGGIRPGIGFEALPADWCCPDCGAGIMEFAAYGYEKD